MKEREEENYLQVGLRTLTRQEGGGLKNES